MRKTMLLSLLFLVVGCDQEAMMEKFAPPEDQAVSKQAISTLRERRFEELETTIDASLASPNLRDTLKRMADLIPAGDPLDIKLVGAHQSHTPGERIANITYQYEFPDRWLLINVAVLTKDGVQTIVGFNVNPISESLEEQFKFRLSGKTPLHYLTGFLVLCLPLFTLFTLIVCIRSRIRGRKWLWILFIVVGVGKFSLNWSTDDWQIMPLAVQLLSAGAFAPLYGPWTLSFSVPLGAILFWLRRDSLVLRESGS